MWANPSMTNVDRAAGSVAEQLMMKVLAAVTEIMVDDVSLAEQLRAAAMTIWLAERRTWDPRCSAVAWRDVQRGEQQLRRLLYDALRQGYLYEARFDRLMALLGQLRRRQPIAAVADRSREDCTGQFAL